jgi:hypothetical protein
MAVGAADPLEGPSISFEQPDISLIFIGTRRRYRPRCSTLRRRAYDSRHLGLHGDHTSCTQRDLTREAVRVAGRSVPL